MRPVMNRHIISIISAIVAGMLPLAVIVVSGFRVPVVFQAEFTQPAPAMQPDDSWSQTFLFPDRPITGVSLRAGTYARRSAGQISGWIGPAFLFNFDSDSPDSRRFVIDLQSLRDNRWLTCSFPALELSPETPSVLRLFGSNLPVGDAFTLWYNSMDVFPDGVFSINGFPQKGDLCFKILTPFRGLDALRIVKDRWQQGRPRFWGHPFWPMGLALLWPACIYIGILLILRESGNRQ